MGVPYLRVPIIRILLFRVLYQGHLFSETPKRVEFFKSHHVSTPPRLHALILGPKQLTILFWGFLI